MIGDLRIADMPWWSSEARLLTLEMAHKGALRLVLLTVGNRSDMLKTQKVSTGNDDINVAYTC